MLQHHIAAVAAGGVLLAAVAAIADDRRPLAARAAPAFFQAACPGGGAGGCRPPPRRSFRVGDIAPAGQVHRIKKPGLYGLSDPPNGDAYAVLEGELIRIDASSGQILSVLWKVERLLD